ncbi:MAG: c-type cytochrome [Lentimicrobium sp.]|nr:c-type cytochrome [Lentimicrobium sp.]
MSHTPIKSGYSKANMVWASLIVIMLTSMFSHGAYAQDEGKQLFEKNCQVCHKLGGGKLVGPELVGVPAVREREWLVKFIRNSKELIESGDPHAIEVFEANNKIPMQAFPNLSDGEINSIIDYIANWEPPKKPAFTVDVNKKSGFTETEILRGERMFHGLIPFENGGTTACFTCHYTKTTDSLDWNPSAHDLAVAFMENDGMNMYESMREPTSAVMQKAHAEYKLTEEETYNIAAYLSEFSHEETKPLKIFPARLMIFLLFALLMTLALIDLIFTKKIKFKAIHYTIIIIGLAVHFNIAMVEAQNLSRTPDYAPDQPIKFSHKVHAGDNETDCQYCHHIADFSKSAGIPSNDVCLNCHNVVLEGRNSGKFEINKIKRAEKTGKSVEWIRVHNLQDHVFFSHAQHVNAGQIECEECHGPVAEMDILKQFNDLSMGWCIECHRDTKVNFKGNEYYSTYMKLHDELKAGKIDSVTVEQIGGLDCMKCHY